MYYLRLFIFQLSLTIDPSINDYEARLLEIIALEYFEAHPSSLLTDENGALLLPTITERRIHIGFHNSRVFMGTPVLTNVIPQLDENGMGSDLTFQGQVELPKYIAGESGMALVFVVEYKVVITAKAPPEKKPGFFSPAPKTPTERTYIEKLVCVGWSWWDICENFAGSLNISTHLSRYHQKHHCNA
jgi:hypothetical protein